VFVTQAEALGLGHAVLCAKPVIGDEPFAVLLPDDLIWNRGPGALKQMADAAQASGASVIATQDVPREKTGSYGIAATEGFNGRQGRITAMVEKPKPADAPSNLIITGRYILQPEIFDLLETQQKGAGGEIQLTDALLRLLKQQPGYGFQFEGRTFDCGSKLGFLSANVAYALARDDIAPAFRSELKKLLG
jgi:UTP--glucose-1-phosphate uridylyltransferase